MCLSERTRFKRLAERNEEIPTKTKKNISPKEKKCKPFFFYKMKMNKMSDSRMFVFVIPESLGGPKQYV